MKRIIEYSIIISFIFIPMVVEANIICNDGTVSPSCGDCHRGCCSRHGGCTDNPNQGEGNSSSYSEAQNSESTVQETESSQNSMMESETEQQISVESVPNNRQEVKIDNVEEDEDEYNYNEEDELELADGLIGLTALGIIGAVIYNTKKKKG